MIIDTYVEVRERPQNKGKMWLKFVKLECPNCGKVHVRRFQNKDRNRGYYCTAECKKTHTSVSSNWWEGAWNDDSVEVFLIETQLEEKHVPYSLV